MHAPNWLRVSADVQKVNFQNEKLRNEVEELRSRLEETEWCLCQKTGENALLKTQLKDCQVNKKHFFCDS